MLFSVSFCYNYQRLNASTCHGVRPFNVVIPSWLWTPTCKLEWCICYLYLLFIRRSMLVRLIV